MNRRLRRRHLAAWLIIGPAAAAVLIAGVLLQRSKARAAERPPAAWGARP
ncbi:MAG: hypothetical protein JNJ48_07850 [Phycisphaerae bacterium]|nr:hypothetical protein [Phycisphaerae bacterium]